MLYVLPQGHISESAARYSSVATISSSVVNSIRFCTGIALASVSNEPTKSVGFSAIDGYAGFLARQWPRQTLTKSWAWSAFNSAEA